MNVSVRLEVVLKILERSMFIDIAIYIFKNESRIVKPMWDFSRDLYFKGFKWKS